MVEYEIKYSKITNVYIQIKEGKVIVRAPKRLSKKAIDELVSKKESWINKSLEKSMNKIDRKPLYSENEFENIIQDTFKELINITGLVPNNIKIKQMKYAWGSCSAKKNISINHELIKYSRQAIRYVVLHELCHLKHMNHSKEFWALVERYLPNYKEIKKEFKK